MAGPTGWSGGGETTVALASMIGPLLTLSPFAMVHAILASFTTVHVVLHYRRPATAVAYLFAAWTIPLLGSLSYFVFSVGSKRRKIRVERRTSLLRKGGRVEQSEDPYDGAMDDPRLVKILNRSGTFPLCGGNELTLLTHQDHLLDPMLDEIASAEREILLETFILSRGRVAKRLIDALADAVGRGVRVRVVFDPIGSRALPSHVLQSMRDRGIEVHTFLTPNPLKGRFQVNFRNHRKILVIDARIAFVGDSNWTDDYAESIDSNRSLINVDVRIEGPAVAHVRRIFCEDWCVAVECDLDDADFEAVDAVEPAASGSWVRVIPHGPDEPTDALWSIFGAAIHSAEKDILLVTPFFVPGATMTEALRLAAVGGVRVRILLPERSDSVFVTHASRFYLERLVRAGAEVWWHSGDFLHAKMLCIDGKWTTTGSCNFDHRSFFLNYELNLEVTGPEFATEITDFVESELERSRRVTLEDVEDWSWDVKFRAKLAALFEPIL